VIESVAADHERVKRRYSRKFLGSKKIGCQGAVVTRLLTGAEAEAPAYYQGVPPDFAKAWSGRPGRMFSLPERANNVLT